jgi:hypothetical protein
MLNIWFPALDSRLEEIDLSEEIDKIGENLNGAVLATCKEMELIQSPRPYVPKPRWFGLDCKRLKNGMKTCLRAFRRNQETKTQSADNISKPNIKMLRNPTKGKLEKSPKNRRKKQSPC